MVDGNYMLHLSTRPQTGWKEKIDDVDSWNTTITSPPTNQKKAMNPAALSPKYWLEKHSPENQLRSLGLLSMSCLHCKVIG